MFVHLEEFSLLNVSLRFRVHEICLCVQVGETSYIQSSNIIHFFISCELYSVISYG